MTRLMIKNYKVGRTADNDINPSKMPALDSERISRYHAEIALFNDKTIEITDKSSNGTFVNDKRLQKDMPTPVRTSDVITLAGIRFRWQTLPEFEGLTDISGSANTSYTPPVAAPKPALNRQPVQSAAAKQGFSWKSAIIGVAVLLALVAGLIWFLTRPVPVKILRSMADNKAATFQISIYGYKSFESDNEGKEIQCIAPISLGTGVYFDSINGLVLTNYHVIEAFYENKDANIWVRAAPLEKAYKAEIINYSENDSEGKDLAILKIDSEMLSQLKKANVQSIVFAEMQGQSEESLQGQSLYAMGYPALASTAIDSVLISVRKKYIENNSEYSDTKLPYSTVLQDAFNDYRDIKPNVAYLDGAANRIEHFSGQNRGKVLIHSIQTTQGMSGGPTFLKESNLLVGINQSYNQDGYTNKAYRSVLLSEVRNFLDSTQGVQYYVYPYVAK